MVIELLSFWPKALPPCFQQCQDTGNELFLVKWHDAFIPTRAEATIFYFISTTLVEARDITWLLSMFRLNYENEDDQFSFFTRLVTILNPISLLSCAVHFWVDLKAYNEQCCTWIYSVSFTIILWFYEVFTGNNFTIEIGLELSLVLRL